MIPYCYPSRINSSTGLRECVVYYLSGVTGLARWTDYIPVKNANSQTITEGTTDNNGFQAVGILVSNTGLNAWVDYIPVYQDTAATRPWEISTEGYIPCAASGSTTGAASYDFYLNLTTPVNAIFGDNQAAGTITQQTPADFFLNLTTPTNSTIGDAQAYGTITGSPDSLITPSVAVSRANGSGNLVAPLAVFFDASATTSSWTSRPFHDLEYRWDFGDETVSTWTYGAQPGVLLKNVAFGPVAAHVYENDGTFTPSLQVRYGSDVANHTMAAITVISADSHWEGTKTICVNPDGDADFTGAPSGALQVNSSNSGTAVSGNIGSGDKRILFKRGCTWTHPLSITQDGPGMLGSYGSGAKPIISLGSAVTAITLSSPSTPTIKDWRILDIRVNGNGYGGGSHRGVNGDGSMNNVLIARMDFDDLNVGVRMSDSQLDSINAGGYTSPFWDGLFLIDNTVFDAASPTGANGFYVGGWRVAVMGNLVDNNNNGEHGMRCHYSDGGVWQHNTIQNIPTGRAYMSLRSPNQGGATLAAQLPGIVYSQKNVASHNRFIGSANVSTFAGIGPINQSSNGRSRDAIWERNLFECGTGTVGCVSITGWDVTIRNNIAFEPVGCDSVAFGVSYYDAGTVTANSIPVMSGLAHYHNTVVSRKTATRFSLGLGQSPDNTVFQNNLMYAPDNAVAHDGRHWLYQRDDYPSIPLTLTPTNCNTLISELHTSPNFTVTNPTTLAGAKPLSGGYAIGRGTVVPVWSDFYGVLHGATPTIGAIKE